MASVYEYVISGGVIIPQISDIITDVQNEYISTFGSALSLAPSTPQGILITAETIARSEVVQNNAALANQINPNEAGGIFLDALGALTGFYRSKQTFSTIFVNVAGVPNTVIGTAATAKDSNNNIYQNTAIITLDNTGLGSGIFKSVTAGPITTAANTLTTIVNGVLGWETVTNPSTNTIIGVLTQSDISYKRQRANTLGLQGTALPVAITSALYALNPTVNLSYQENYTDATVVMNGITMRPHSIYTCVSDLGYVLTNGVTPYITNAQIAQVLLSKKNAGAAWNGSTSVNVTDPTSHQIYPVLFDRPDLISILIRATVDKFTVPSNATNLIKQAILDYSQGNLNLEPGFVVFSPVSCFELAGAINEAYPQIYVINLETTVSSNPSGWSNDPIPIGIKEQAFTTLNQITVVIT